MDNPFEFSLDLPERGSRQRLAALHGQLHAAILDGTPRAGLRLPATRVVADALGVSRNTVVATYDLLLSEGYIVARRGAGNFVADLAARRPVVPAKTLADHNERRVAPYWRDIDAMPAPMALGEFTYDFRLGIPDSRPFPYEVWRRLAARALRHLSKAAPLY